MNSDPRRKRKTLNEFRHEILRSRDRHMVVEGATDKRLIQSWIENNLGSERIAVHAVDALDVPDELIHRRALRIGQRSRVIVVAEEFPDSRESLLCVADRDTEGPPPGLASKSLVFTDFPAIESYVLHPAIFARFHRNILDEKLSEAGVLLEELGEALRSLWKIRCANPNLPKPKYDKGVVKGAGLRGYDGSKAVDLSVVREAQDKTSRALGEAEKDFRHIAYGHDISELLFSGFRNTIKNQLGYANASALEGALRAILLGSNELNEEPLFVHIHLWAIGDPEKAPVNE